MDFKGVRSLHGQPETEFGDRKTNDRNKSSLGRGMPAENFLYVPEVSLWPTSRVSGRFGDLEIWSRVERAWAMGVRISQCMAEEGL